MHDGIFNEGHKSLFSAVCTLIDSTWANSLPLFIFLLSEEKQDDDVHRGKKTSEGQKNVASSQQHHHCLPAASPASPTHAAVTRMSLDQINVFVMIHRHCGTVFRNCIGSTGVW